MKNEKRYFATDRPDIVAVNPSDRTPLNMNRTLAQELEEVRRSSPSGKEFDVYEVTFKKLKRIAVVQPKLKIVEVKPETKRRQSNGI